MTHRTLQVEDWDTGKPVVVQLSPPDPPVQVLGVNAFAAHTHGHMRAAYGACAAAAVGLWPEYNCASDAGRACVVIMDCMVDCMAGIIPAGTATYLVLALRWDR